MAHAVVLAGNGVPGELKAPGIEARALIPVDGRPVLVRVLEALRGCPSVDEVLVVGPPGLRETAGGPPGVQWMDGTEDAPTNLRRSLRGLGLSTPVLITAADLALLTPSLVDLLVQSHPRGVDVAYPLVSADEFQAAFPALPAPAVRLRDGSFVGGRIVLAKPQAVVMNHGLLQRAFAGGLSFGRLLGLLGWNTRILHGMGLLTSRGIAARATRALAAPCLPVFGMPPDLALTLDSAEHVRAAERRILLAGDDARRGR